MICNVCGKELPEDSLFCKYCGNKLERNNVDDNTNNENVTELMPSYAVVQPLPNNSDVVVNVAAEEVEKKIKKSKKKPIIIVSVLLLVICLTILAVIFLAGRKLDRTIESFAQAYEDRDEDKLIKYMFPRNVIEGVQEYLDENDIDLYENFEEVFGDDADLEDLHIVDEEEVSDDLIDDIDDILDETDIDLEYDEIKIVLLSFEDSNEENSGDVIKVISYKVDKNWYIVPGVLEYVKYLRQDDDIKQGEKIATALQTTLGLEAADTAIAPYYDVIISMDDLDYLPQAFNEEFKRCMEDIDYQQRHTEDGAIGYAYKISPSGEVEVYISSDSKMDEWKVYPEVNDDYYDGIKEEVTGTALSSEYSYVKLISERSPIMGYWQSDKAGMYIGYNVSGGDEGFTVYLQSQDVNFQLLHGYEGYTYSGGAGNIRLFKDGSEHTATYDIQVVDNDTIKLYVTDGRYSIDANTEYTFKRAEITKETLSEFEGAWISGGELFGMGSYGYVIDLAYCNECGCIHKKDHEDTEGESYHSNRHVALYDGKTLHYIFPQNGLLSHFEGWTNYNGVNYKIEGNTLYEEVYGHNGGAGAADCTYFREGSEQAQIAEALNAYQGYINNNTEYFLGVELVYVDGDTIPECVVKCQFDTGLRERVYMITYYNRQVVVLDNNMTASSISLKDGLNEIRYDYQGSMQALEGTEIYTLEEGVFNQQAKVYSLFESPDSTDYVWYVDNAEVDETTYKQTLDSFGEYTVLVVGKYSSLGEAYNNLKKPIDASKYDTGNSVVVEEGDTVWVSVEEKYEGAAGFIDWKSSGEEEIVVSVDSLEFDRTDYGLSDEEKQANVNQTVGKGVGDSFELSFSGGDGTRTYRYTILGIKKN